MYVEKVHVRIKVVHQVLDAKQIARFRRRIDVPVVNKRGGAGKREVHCLGWLPRREWQTLKNWRPSSLVFCDQKMRNFAISQALRGWRALFSPHLAWLRCLALFHHQYDVKLHLTYPRSVLRRRLLVERSPDGRLSLLPICPPPRASSCVFCPPFCVFST